MSELEKNTINLSESHEIDNDEQVEEKSQKKKLLSFTPMTFLLGGVISAIVLALLVQFVLTPAWNNVTAQKELDNVKSESGPITAVNTQMATFQGQKLPSANTSQKALASGSVVTEPAGFIFANGKSNPNARVVDIYLDFGSQRSRDLVLLNQNNLRGMIEGGTVVLRVHPVPNGNVFTMYSSEALAESFTTTPKKSWDFFLELMRMSASLKPTDSGEVSKEIAKTAKALNIKGVDEKSIENGTFASWIISVGDDPKLKTGYYPPLIYVNGDLLDSKLNLNDADTLRREILKR